MNPNPAAPGRATKPPTLSQRIAPRVSELARQGESPNSIARQLDCAPATVTKAARLAGVSFDTTGVEVATSVVVARASATRAELSEMAAGIATDAGRRLRTELAAHVLDPGAVRGLATTFGIAVDKSLALAATLPNTEEAQATICDRSTSISRYADDYGMQADRPL